MPAGELADAVSAFVETFERIGRGLDFDIEVSTGRHGAAAPGPRERLFPEWAWTWDVWAALAQAAGRSGPTAAPVYAASVEARDLLLRSLEGDPDAWRRDRERVLELVATIRGSCQAPAVVGTSVTRSAAGAPATATVDCPTGIPETDGDKGEKGEKSHPVRRRSARPNGRPPKDCDKELRRLVRSVGAEIRAEFLDPTKELPARVFSQTSESLGQMLKERLKVDIAPSTIRSCRLWQTWKRYRSGNPQGLSHGLETSRGTVERDAVSTDGAKRSADERKVDAATDRWLRANNLSLDDG
jgi:hypothetical protein